MKVCTRCFTAKVDKEFSKDRSKADGLQKWCKACYREWRQENKDRVNQRNREWRQENIESVKRQEAAYRDAHRDKLQAYARTYAAAHPEERRANKRRARQRAHERKAVE